MTDGGTFDRIRVSIKGVRKYPSLGGELETASYEKTLEGDVICRDCVEKVMGVLKKGKEIVNGQIREASE